MPSDQSARDDAPQRVPHSGVDAHLTARRQMIKSAIAAVPVVLTVTAGTAQAQGSMNSTMYAPPAPAPGPGGGGLEGAPSESFDVEQQLDDLMQESDSSLDGSRFLEEPF